MTAKILKKYISAACLSALVLLSSCHDTGTGTVMPDKQGIPGKNGMTVTVYDADKGDAFLVSSGDYNMLIDCGRKDDADEIIDDLKEKNIGSIDLLIISHFDKDHVGGASKIVKNMLPRRIITTYRTNDDKRTEKFFEALDKTGLKNEVLSADIMINDEDSGLSVLISPPLKTSYPDDEDNNSSLLVRISGKYGSMLFTGDAVNFRIDEILEKDGIKSDVLKVPHHGTKLWRFDELLDRVSPSFAVTTSSAEEPADPSGTELLDKKGIEHFDTRDIGGFDIVFDEKGIRINDK